MFVRTFCTKTARCGYNYGQFYKTTFTVARSLNVIFYFLKSTIHVSIIPTQCFYCYFGDFDWSVGKIKLILHFDKNPCVGIFDICDDFTVLDCVDNNELYIKLYNFHQIKYS